MVMELRLKDIQVIDRENNLTHSKEIPLEFSNYLQQILDIITNNEVVREYKIRNNNTFVVSQIKEVLTNQLDAEKIKKCFQNVAEKLLEKEVIAQQKINKMNVEVQVGSLIQAVFYDDEKKKYLYLLAKVEHISFVNDEDYSFQTGFQKELKKVFKSCIFLIKDAPYSVEGAKIYLDNVAKYWFNDFLELDEVTTDEINTERAFKSIDSYLNRSLKKDYPEDRSILRNSFIRYFRANELINYREMIDTILTDYKPETLSNDKIENIKDKLLELPSKKSFDSLFEVSLDALKARIRTTYDLYPGIKLKVEDNLEKIQSKESSDGRRYIVIETTDEKAFNDFKISEE